MTNIFVVIVNYNEKENTYQLLKQLGREKGKFKISTIIVDNNSTDESIIFLKKKKQKNVILLPQNRNLGYGKAANKGIRLALYKKADYLCFLNSDVILQKDFFSKILKNKADMTGPVIKYKKEGKNIYDLGGIIDWRIGRTKHQEFLIQPEKYERQPDYISGCCILIKRYVFETIGLFDERFFLYFEDVDLQVRAKNAGFSLKLDTDLIVTHNLKGVGENERKSFANLYYNIRSNLLFIFKYQHGIRLAISLCYLLVLGFKVVLNRLFQ